MVAQGRGEAGVTSEDIKRLKAIYTDSLTPENEALFARMLLDLDARLRATEPCPSWAFEQPHRWEDHSDRSKQVCVNCFLERKGPRASG